MEQIIIRASMFDIDAYSLDYGSFQLINADIPYPSIKSGGWFDFEYTIEDLQKFLSLVYKYKAEKGLFFLWGKEEDMFTYYDCARVALIPKHDQIGTWVKPLSTKNPAVNYASFIEQIMIWGAGFSINRNPGISKKTGKLKPKTSMKDWESFTNRVFPRTETLIKKNHPHAKPEALMRTFLLNHTESGDSVLDTCAGSGKLYELCQEMDLNYVGFEVDPDAYCWSLL